MSDSEPGRVRAEQLIYTNVEADLSPTRQRGFQVWLGSPAWTTEQKRDITRRLDNFRLPVGAAATDATLARHTYFPTAGKLFVVARTVPLAGKDKFGRGGRFHAHALVLTEAEFARVGFNPFRVLGGGFAFHGSPEEAMAIEGWRSGSLPPVDLVVTDPTPVDTSIPPDRLRSLAAHLERDEDRPLMLALPPGDALAAFRNLFAWLPPSARRGIVFDTLWTGEPGSQMRCHLAGGYSADNVRTWMSRRYVRLALPGWETQPALEPPGDELPTRLLAEPRWGELDDRDRDAAYRAGRALAARRVDGADVADLTPAALEALEACAAVRPAIAEAIQTRIKSDLDPVVARLSKIRGAVDDHFAGPLVEQLNKLSRPIPNKLAESAVRAALLEPSYEPSPKLLDFLDQRMSHADPLVRLIVARWRGGDADLTEIEEALKSPPGAGEVVRQFRAWVLQTLGPEFQNPGPELSEQLRPDRDVPAESLRDARLYLALTPSTVNPERTKLRFLTAYHSGPDQLDDFRTSTSHREIRDSGILDYVQQARVQLAPGWLSGRPEDYFLGVQLVPCGEADARLLDLAAWAAEQPGMSDWRTNFLRKLVPAANPDKKDFKLSATEVKEDVPKATKTLVELLLSASPEKLDRAAEALREQLRSVGDSEFRLVANEYLFARFHGEPAVFDQEARTYAGLRLKASPSAKLSHYLKLFEALAGSVVAEFDPAQPATAAPSRPELPRRFIWMLARLGDVAKTGRWLV